MPSLVQTQTKLEQKLASLELRFEPLALKAKWQCERLWKQRFLADDNAVGDFFWQSIDTYTHKGSNGARAVHQYDVLRMKFRSWTLFLHPQMPYYLCGSNGCPAPLILQSIINEAEIPVDACVTPTELNWTFVQSHEDTCTFVFSK
jgi:hypothetical protein